MDFSHSGAHGNADECKPISDEGNDERYESTIQRHPYRCASCYRACWTSGSDWVSHLRTSGSKSENREPHKHSTSLQIPCIAVK